MSHVKTLNNNYFLLYITRTVVQYPWPYTVANHIINNKYLAQEVKSQIKIKTLNPI